MAEPRKTRPVSWLKAALNEFEKFPEGAKAVCLAALTIAAEGGKADIAKPMQGLARPSSRSRWRLRATPSPRLCVADRRRHLGGACLPEEIDEGHQDAQTRDRPD
jgi:hypothetical protein